ncbi:hypothetical protein D1J60_33795 [Streptomyces sp. W1SF4]|nr:hypothetical protein D1J60_33795 [Streptomyces sp. W1SF4]
MAGAHPRGHPLRRPCRLGRPGRRLPDRLGVLSRGVGGTRAGCLEWVRASGCGVDRDICTEFMRPSWSTAMPR